MIASKKPQRNIDWNEKVQFTCIECGDAHHPSERDDHEFRLDTTTCPECGGKRKLITHDLSGEVNYSESTLNRLGLTSEDTTAQ
jgi:Zn finger protein HypA/HybF involved in hydrogenase expression